MENWKLALVGGAAGVGTIMLLKRKWTAGIILAGVGVAMLAIALQHCYSWISAHCDDEYE